MKRRVALAAAFLFAASLTGADTAPASYEQSIRKWREEREAGLKADYGWLTLVGLYWLKPGENIFGSAPNGNIVLSAPGLPAKAGAFHLEDGKVGVRVAPGISASVNGKTVQAAPLLPDTSEKPDVLQIGSIRMYVIQRGDRLGIRIKDNHSDQRKRFNGLRWYPIDRSFRVEARFVPFPSPKVITVPDHSGGTQNYTVPGYVEFHLDGRQFHLEPAQENGGLFFVFRDKTSGRETYPSGRFLDADPPKNGKVLLDFNMAYNPPCAFTPYATCPLPPRQNSLPIAIPAGELNYGQQ